MRRLLTVVSTRVALVAAGLTGIPMIALTMWYFHEQDQRAATGRPPVEPGFALVTVALVMIIMVIIGVALGRSVAARDAGQLTRPMAELADRAEQLGSGDLGTERAVQRDIDGERLDTGIAEIDKVSRILERSARQITRALTSERSFAADASHQLRTPLAALLMRLEEIASTDDLEDIRAEASVAIAQTERLAEVVDDLLQRTRAGHADGGRSVSLDTILAALQREWQPAFEKARRSIRVTGERGMVVRSTHSALSQIFSTLLENALIHGGGTVEIRARRSGPSAVIEVSDQGEGVDPALAQRVFERAVGSGRGTGLGLGLARDIAESAGGRLELVRARPAVFALYVSMASVR